MNVKGMTAVLFDLDGTLAPMDVDIFTKTYFEELGKKAASIGLEPKQTVKAVWEATKFMFTNDGSANNDERFWQGFADIMGPDSIRYRTDFDQFYIEEFDCVKRATSANPYARQLVDLLKNNQLELIVATNPLFPVAANHTRLGWVDLKGEDFAYITSYENSSYCKPNPQYYEEIMAVRGLKPENCLMIGNDVTEDMVAKDLGMQVYLVTDCLINKDDADISKFENGGFAQLYESMKAAFAG